MFYRQKVLLSMLEFGKVPLSSMDLEKLLFLYCQTTRKNYYDFFPSQHGAFSLMYDYDKQKLIEKDVLRDSDSLELTIQTSYSEQLHEKERVQLHNFSHQTRHLRGKALLRQTYLDHPKYALKSQLVTTLLDDDEYNSVRSSWKLESDAKLFTIGYEDSSIDYYLARLLFNNVKVLVDVRKNPVSRKYGFSKKRLRHWVAENGINYYHLPELGIPSSLRKNLATQDDFRALFDMYASDILPQQTNAISQIKQLLSKHNRVALTCFEAEHDMCHRHKVADIIEADTTLNIAVEHI